MAATATEDQVSLTLLVDKEKDKVLFAEAGKDFVDVLFSFLTLPLGTIARLVSKESYMPPVRVGCLSSLYESVTKLDQQCFWTEACKEMLLRPRNSSEAYCRSLKLNIDDTEPTKYFLCEDLDSCSKNLLSTFKNQRCDCGKFFTKEVPLKSNGVFEGFVKDGATFIITDDLIVMPNSMDTRLTSFGLLQNFGVENISSAHQVTESVTHKKLLDLLKWSLFSKSTLTDFFFGEKPVLEVSRFCSCDISSNSIQINVMLTMRKSDGKILYAQGEEDFADFLFSFLTLPLGAVVRLLEGHSYVGSIDGMYKSIVELNQNKYLISHEVKDRLVDPCLAPHLVKHKLPISESYASQYYCYYNEAQGVRGSIINHRCYVTSESMSYYDYTFETCMNLFHSKSYGRSSQGYVKGPTMYMATDDLVVAPMSPIFGISLLNRLNVPLDDLMEKAITIGIKEGLSILKASLTTTSALTNGLSHLIAEVKQEK